MRAGLGPDNPAFRQVFTSRFIPDGTDEQIGWFNELCRKTTSGRDRGRGVRDARSHVDVVDLLPQVATPTLVLHARDDAVVPFSEGHVLAAGIPNAQFVELDSRNHILLENEPAWERFRDAVLDFIGLTASLAAARTRRSPRSRRASARSWRSSPTASATRRSPSVSSISEKTVRNHVSNLFDKLGVWTRAQAIVFAHDRGFAHASRDSRAPR